MSTDADNNAQESQFQNIGDLVERNDETGVMSVESLCMNCHENVCDYGCLISFILTYICIGNYPNPSPARAFLQGHRG
jgi:hypothetical protein